jgi:hypothetical protein
LDSNGNVNSRSDKRTIDCAFPRMEITDQCVPLAALGSGLLIGKPSQKSKERKNLRPESCKNFRPEQQQLGSEDLTAISKKSDCRESGWNRRI